jgi:hypothetical protein
MARLTTKGMTMKGFSETCTVELPVLADYTMEGTTLTVYRIDVAGANWPFNALPEVVREAVIAQLTKSIRAYEDGRKTLPDLL